MNPVQITINGHSAELGGYIPVKVYSLDIKLHINVNVSKPQATQIKAWLNEVMKRLDTQYVSYNGTLILATDLKEF